MVTRRLNAVLTFLGTSLLLIGTLATPAAAGGVTRWVDDDRHAGPSGCDSHHTARKRIQGAIDVSGPGDTILVCPGVYRETLRITGSGKNGLRVRSVKVHAAVIKAPNTVVTATRAGVGPAGESTLVTIYAVRRVTFQAFRLLFPTAQPCFAYDAGFYLGAGSRSLTVSRNVIRATGSDTLGDSNGCGYHDGIEMFENHASVVTGNTIRDFGHTGIFVGGAATVPPTISSNTISYWHAAEGPSAPDCARGIDVFGDAEPIVAGNQLVGLSSAGAPGGTPVLCSGLRASGAGPDLIFRGNIVRYAFTGIDVLANTGGTLARNTVRNSRLYGVSVLSADDAEVRFNEVHGSGGAGIVIDDHSSSSTIHDNDFRANKGTDCLDYSTGGGAGAPHYGTKDSWIGNHGDEADPAGICAP